MSEKEKQLTDIIFEAICLIEENDEVTVHDVYQILIKVQDINKVPSDIGCEYWGG